MSAPKPATYLRSGLRKISREVGEEEAVRVALDVLHEFRDRDQILNALGAVDLGQITSMPEPDVREAIVAAGGLMGATEAADTIGIKGPNIGKVRGLEPVARISVGRIPVYIGSEVRAAAERRRVKIEARERAREERAATVETG